MGAKRRPWALLAVLWVASCAQEAARPWRAPVLLSARDLTTTVLVQATLSFGDSIRGALTAGGPLHGYVLDAEGGASLRAVVSGDDPALAVYGPRSFDGLFGRPLAARADALAAELRLDLPARGVYLLLVGARRGAGGRYELAVACESGCAAPACRSPVCSLFCAAGFRRDAAGCERCECAGADVASPRCVEGTPCGPGRACRRGVCDAACACPAIVAPVCGRDGRIYDNRCLLDCAGVELAAEGACTCAGRSCPADERCLDGRCVAAPDCSACPNVFAPVCGRDGRTYGNRCLLECAGVVLRGEGACVATAGGCAANCVSDADCGAEGVGCFNGYCQPRGCEPNRAVCGSDGVTYPSSCEIAWCRGVTVTAPGACCLCPPTFAPVCGEDGRTYPNGCAAACAGVPVQGDGACAGSCLSTACDLSCPFGYRKSADGCETCACQEGPSCEVDADCPSPRQRCIQRVCKEACLCPTYWEPVCGTDGVTYANRCEAHCASAGVASEGVCERRSLVEVQRCAEICRLGLQSAVCGADGKTYASACDLCSAGILPAHEGACEPEACPCPGTFEPVCGEDGVTYGNACLAGCRGVNIASAGACPSDSPVCPAFVACALDCPNGYQTDPESGCRICACR